MTKPASSSYATDLRCPRCGSTLLGNGSNDNVYCSYVGDTRRGVRPCHYGLDAEVSREQHLARVADAPPPPPAPTPGIASVAEGAGLWQQRDARRREVWVALTGHVATVTAMEAPGDAYTAKFYQGYRPETIAAFLDILVKDGPDRTMEIGGRLPDLDLIDREVA